MSRRGLSHDEKKKRLLDYLHEHPEPFSLKELESSASKAKGIVSQSIKDVLEHLIADGLVDSDKIGSGNFFWALPSKQRMNLVSRVEKVRSDLAAAESREEELSAALKEAQAARPTSANRAADLKRLHQLKSQCAELEREVEKFADFDPDRLKQLEQGVEVCKAAANRWTDNLQSLIGGIKEMKTELTEEVICEQFGLPKNLDYVG